MIESDRSADTGSGELFLGRAVLALFLGSLVGAFLTSVGVALLAAYSASPTAAPPLEMFLARLHSFRIAPFIFLPALLVWFSGLLMLGAPGWALLHWLRLRSLPVAAAFGATLTSVTFWLVVGSSSGGDGYPAILAGPLLMALAGGVVAVVVQRFAYRRNGLGRALDT